MTTKKVYISGPMTGLPDFNHGAFNLAARYLRSHGGLEVVNPAEIIPDGPVREWTDYMRADIKALVDCDAVVVLPGWEASKGANLELTIAQALGMDIVYLSIRAGEIVDG